VKNPFSPVMAFYYRCADGLRARWGWLDHLARAGVRYNELFGNRISAGLTYYAFLSIFPLLAVAFAVVGYLVTINQNLANEISNALTENFPGLVGGDSGVHLSDFAQSKVEAGVIGLVVLLFTGMTWLSAVRAGLRVMWGIPVPKRNFALRKLDDFGLLILIGTTLIVSIGIAGFGTGYTDQLLTWLNLSNSTVVTLITRGVAITAGLLVDMTLFTLLFASLSGWRPRRRAFEGALMASGGFEVLKLIGSLLLSRTTSNPVYATFAIAVGFLVWMYLVHRVVLFSASWTVTGPGYDGPVDPPSKRWRRPKLTRGKSATETQAADA
jgi:inner membrane protein YhjD